MRSKKQTSSNAYSIWPHERRGFSQSTGSRGSRFNVEPIGRRRFGGVLVDSSLEIENQLRLLLDLLLKLLNKWSLLQDDRFQSVKIGLNCGRQQVEEFGG